MSNFFTSLFSSGASSLVESIGEAIDKNFTTDDERLEREVELKKAKMNYSLENKKLDIEETKAYMQDMNSARENQSRVQESANASWLSKNIQPMLAIGIMFLTFCLYLYVLANEVPQDKKDIIIYILGALTSISVQVASFFFGSSQGSKDKTEHIKKI